MTKSKAVAFTLVILVTCSILPTFIFVNGQGTITVEENMVKLAMQSGKKIQNLITAVNADENALEKIQNANLTRQFEGNVTLYQREGLNWLEAAQKALSNLNYDLAADSALKALSIFRQVYGSLQAILESAGLQDNSLINNQELNDALNRELQRMNTLRNILELNATQQIITLLETSNNTLLQAKMALQEGKYAESQTLYLEARQTITQIYQYLKTIAEECNSWRLSVYCERLRQRIQEKLRYGSQNGINFTSAIESLGYRSEEQFMQTLQDRIQSAQSNVDINKAIQECMSIAQMVQQMEQTLNQEISRQQGPKPADGTSGSSSSNNGAGSNSTNNGNGNSGSGYSGGSNYVNGGSK
ncbi:MAG: hypothetical protein NWE98_09010 [Candidatus Bathyarchaeota archaeon]|nr:hypothetical protein [Candidatus Bathyarchaeota archaeon]